MVKGESTAGIDQSMNSTAVVVCDCSGIIRMCWLIIKKHTKKTYKWVSSTGRIQIIECGITDTSETAKTPRMMFIAGKCADACKKYGAARARIEGIAYGAGSSSVCDLSGLHHVIRCKLSSEGVACDVITASSAKKVATGSGRADKADMLRALEAVLSVEDPAMLEDIKSLAAVHKADDIADAFFICRSGN